MKRSDNRKNRTGLVFLLIFLGLAAGILAGGYFAYRNYEQNFRADADRQLSAIAELKVNQLVQYRKERLGDAQTFFKNPAFSRLVRQFFERRDNGNAEQQLRTWLASYQTFYSYDGLFLLDSRGVLTLSVPQQRVPIASDVQVRALEILRSGKVTMQDFHRNEHNQLIYLTVLVPIADDSEPNRPLGVLLLRIDPEMYLYPFIQTWPVPSRTSETLIVRREGNDVLFLNELRFQKNTALNHRISVNDTAVAAVKAVLGHEGIVDAVDYRGEPVIAAVRKVPDSPWFMVCRMDMAEVSEPLRSGLWMIIIAVGALMSAAGASVGLVWRHQQNRFYREQYKTAEALRESQALLQSIIDHSTSLIYIVDTEGRFLLANRMLSSLLSVTPDKLVGQSRGTVLPKEIATIHRTNDLEVLNSGKAHVYEEHNLEQDGEHVYESVKFPLFDAVGRIYAIGGMSADITERKRAEEALQESEVRFRQTFDLSPVGIVMVGLDKRFLGCNRAFSQFLGYATDEITERTIGDITFPEDRSLGMAEMTALGNGEIANSSVQKRYVRKDGQIVWGEVTMSLVRDQEEHPRYFLSIVQDITERRRSDAELLRLFDISERSRSSLLSILEDQKRAQDVLSKVSSRQEAILGAIPDIIMEVDDNKVYTWANRSGTEFFGNDVIGKEAAFYFEGEQNIYDSVPPLFEGSEGTIYLESWQRRKDGQKRLLGWWCRVLKDGVGQVVGALSTARDITENKQAEEVLRESEDKFRHIFDHSNVGKSITLPTGKITANKAFYEMLGYSPEELPNQRWQNISHPDDNDLTQREIDSLLSGEKHAARFTKRYLHKNGSVVWADVSTSLRRDQQGKPLYFMTSVVDITERYHAEAEIRKLNAELEQRVIERTAQLEAAIKELEAFSYSVSHDLRAPLRSIDGFSQALLEDNGSQLDESGKSNLLRVRTAAQRMGQLIDDVLDLSRIQRVDLSRLPIDLTTMAQEIIADLRRQQPRPRVEVIFGPGLSAVGDPPLIRLLLQNLLENAWKFTSNHDRATIEFGLLESNGKKTFFVRDDGAGFDMAHADMLFGAFQRLHTQTEFPGTGVGLASAQRIVRRHGGKVWAESEVEKGATFFFTL